MKPKQPAFTIVCLALIAACAVGLSSCADMSAKDGSTVKRIDREKLTATLDFLDYILRPEGVKVVNAK